VFELAVKTLRDGCGVRPSVGSSLFRVQGLSKIRIAFAFNLRILSFLALFLDGTRAGAQYFSLSVTPSSGSILVSNSLTFTNYVTNLTDTLLYNGEVTNTLPSSVQFLTASASQGVILTNSTTNGTVIVFDLGTLEPPPNEIAQMTLTVQPTAVGMITDTVTVVSTSVTNMVSTNVTVQVTNIVVLADLGVAISGPAQAVITNDYMTYGVSVTNAGPDAAPNVMLTNAVPPGVKFLGVFPTNQIYTLQTNNFTNNFIFNLGTTTNGGFANLEFTVEPTNGAGIDTFSASVGAPGVLDTNLANNFAGTNIAVMNPLPGTLIATTNSGQSIDLQNGLEEQTILLTNAGTTNVPAARLVVTGLSKQLFNAAGTNNGNPFVYFSAPLATNQSVNLLLQYNPRGAFAFSNSQLLAYAVPLPDWTPPPSLAPVTNNTRIVRLANGNMLLEFPFTLGRTYTVVYSANVMFSNAMIAPPPLVAPANEVQWMDYGPPTTVSAPGNSAARFYEIFQNP